jgi:isopenicillin N synthase-like dioxygenase
MTQDITDRQMLSSTDVIEQLRRFFNLPTAVKEFIAHPPSGEVDDDRGWARIGLGHTVQMIFDPDAAQEVRENNPDFKETLELGNPFSSAVPPNRWPAEHELPGFRSFVESWWKECATLSHHLFGSLCEALQLEDERYLSEMHSKDDCHMTWNFYAAMPLKPLHNANHKRLNAHTDFGTLTLVFQDVMGGLEVHDGQTYRPVAPIPGTVVVNVGDMLEQQSNGRWESALHRVVAPGQLMNPEVPVEDDVVVDRYSLVYFGTPDPEVKIRTLPGRERQGKWKANMTGDWGVLSAREWIQKRLAVEY